MEKYLYLEIIKKAKSENRFKGDGNYYEEHHILPINLFPLWKKRKLNKVLLTGQEHFYAHKYLAKIYKGNLTYTYWKMVNRKGLQISPEEFEEAKILHANESSIRMSKLRKGKDPWNKGLKGNEIQLKAAIKRTATFIKRYGGFLEPPNKGKTPEELYGDRAAEHRKKCGIANIGKEPFQKNKKAYNNGEICKYYEEGKQPDGWVHGNLSSKTRLGLTPRIKGPNKGTFLKK